MPLLATLVKPRMRQYPLFFSVKCRGEMIDMKDERRGGWWQLVSPDRRWFVEAMTPELAWDQWQQVLLVDLVDLVQQQKLRLRNRFDQLQREFIAVAERRSAIDKE